MQLPIVSSSSSRWILKYFDGDYEYAEGNKSLKMEKLGGIYNRRRRRKEVEENIYLFRLFYAEFGKKTSSLDDACMHY